MKRGIEMKDYNIYETVYPAVGEPFVEFVGSVEARTEGSALRKAVKHFKVHDGGIPVRYRRPENFSAKERWR